MRRSPTTALLWAMWRQHRAQAWLVVALTVAGRLLYVLQRRGNRDVGPLIDLLGMLAFLLTVGIFNFTDASDPRGVRRFPSSLFTLPVSTLRLVATPMLAGIVCVELFYLAWMDPLSRGGSTSAAFIGVILAVLMVSYQAILWTLDRLGTMRLVILGMMAVLLFAIGIAPSFQPTPPPPWRSEAALSAVMFVMALGVFGLVWKHMGGRRSGGAAAGRSEPLLEQVAGWLPARRTDFRSAAAAQFWFEWRCSGLVLPALVAGVLLALIAPLSIDTADPDDTLRLLLGALATPIVLALPVGIGFSRPTLWSDDLGIPSFVAVRPLRDADLVAVKLRVAAATVLLSWAIILTFVAVWLSSWANLESLSQLALQLWAFHGQSTLAVYGIALLVVLGGIFLTWRLLVIRLWSGLSGHRPVFVGAVVALVVCIIAALAFDATRLPAWLLQDHRRLTVAVWIAAALVVAKYWLSAYFWRHHPP